MDWMEQLKKTCLNKGYDLVQDKGTLVIICPDEPEESFKNSLKTLVTVPLEFRVAPSVGTQMALLRLVELLGGQMEVKNHHLNLNCHNDAPDESLWDNLSELLSKDVYFKSWSVTVKGKDVMTHDRNVAKECQTQHNLRDLPFSNDDILNLRISLNACNSVEEFIKEIS